MAARAITPISASEFTSMIREVIPPVGWSKTLAVGNSGGPDSICLLFLLNRYLKSQREANLPSAQDLPQIVSLSVDHNLQESSAAMANQAATMAESMGVRHITSNLLWGQGSYPQKPGPEDKIEEKARDMRQMVLFERMKNLDANALALGHHLDDQVETMFMRLGMGSNQDGLAGMRPCRRWGMGSKNEAGELYAIEGMRRWIVRPLLGITKDRILATCEEQNLNYVTDNTNFQPHLTIRNAIRHILNHGGRTTDNFSEMASLAHIPPSTIQNLVDIENSASRVPGHSFSLNSSLEDLRTMNQTMSTIRLNTDKAVDEIIKTNRIPSPPGTFMISPLSIKSIDSQVVREALLFRITRYVSPEPWGHPQAELGRRKASVNRLAKHLCDIDSFSTRENNSLCVGSGVWWRLVSILPSKLSLDVKGVDSKQIAWIALRQPQIRSDNKQAGQSILDDLAPEITKEVIQGTETLSQDISQTMELLYDHRFLICFSLDKIPRSILETLMSGTGRIFIRSTKPWAIPHVVLQIDDTSKFIQTAVISEPFLRHRQLGGRRSPKDVHSDWITIQYFRPLSSI